MGLPGQCRCTLSQFCRARPYRADKGRIHQSGAGSAHPHRCSPLSEPTCSSVLLAWCHSQTSPESGPSLPTLLEHSFVERSGLLEPIPRVHKTKKQNLICTSELCASIYFSKSTVSCNRAGTDVLGQRYWCTLSLHLEQVQAGWFRTFNMLLFCILYLIRFLLGLFSEFCLFLWPFHQSTPCMIQINPAIFSNQNWNVNWPVRAMRYS